MADSDGAAERIHPRILVVDAFVFDNPGRHIREVHPELAFMAMSGRPLDSKKTAVGVAQRLRALETWRTNIVEEIERAPHGVPMDDCLDALACLWSATRIAAGTAQVMPNGATSAPWITY